MATLDNYVINCKLEDRSTSEQDNVSIYHGLGVLSVSLHGNVIVIWNKLNGEVHLQTVFDGKAWDTTSTKRAMQRALDQLGVPGYVRRISGRIRYHCPSLHQGTTWTIGERLTIKLNGQVVES